MLDQDRAGELVSALLILGFDAWPQALVQGGWGVWCETAGLLFQDEAQLRAWLRRQLIAETGQEVMAYG